MVIVDTHIPKKESLEQGSSRSRKERLQAAIEHAAHLLPAQGPITVFIHHNTLHTYEDRPFDEAVKVGAKTFNCEPYLTEARYREALNRGRIRFSDLRAELEDTLGPNASESIANLCTRLELRLTMVQYPLAHGSAAELRWLMAETDALRSMRPDISALARGRLIAETRRWVMRDLRALNGSNPKWVRELFDRFGVADIERWSPATWEAFTLESLWQVCREGTRLASPPRAEAGPFVRHRDLLWHLGGIDTDLPVHDILIRFTAAFLDQGVSHWALPGREHGFFRSFCALYGQAVGPPDRWLRTLGPDASRLLNSDTSPLDAACESLAAMGVPAEQWDEYIAQTLLALRGWAGMIHQVELRGDRVAHPVPAGTLMEFVAVRLLLEKHAVATAARDALGYGGPLTELRANLQPQVPLAAEPGIDERAYPLFQVAQALGWTPGELQKLSEADWGTLFQELDAFSAIERRALFHLAYERRLREQSLDALALHTRQTQSQRPQFQVVTCLDEREESFRRHLEEVAPHCETFGAAGFFAVPMYYRGATDAHFIPLCPIVVTPGHWIEERPVEEHEELHTRTIKIRRWLGATAHRTHVGTRTFALGAFLTSVFGVLASVPLVLRILFPRLTGRLRGQVSRFVSTTERTALTLERSPECIPAPRSGQLGFTAQEMADRAERLLRDIGLTTGFAPLVFLIGHGSNSLNNPHKSAYDCGACGGSPGAPNGRAAADILNDERVRGMLVDRGIVIPPDTLFMGGYHNTCDDSVIYFEANQIPDSHRSGLDAARRAIEIVCDRNAHERCRRFMSAPLTLTPAEARRHVEARSQDLAQTRPELGHATNAICVVGRRERTRGLYFDRRAFLTSYDPTTDGPGAPVLTRTLQAVFPVCGGINLEYYFSHVDSPGYGCGTKLPHNVSALLGVMDGAASDLRTGLPWQMVEIHEPVRLLIICETTPEVMIDVLKQNPALGSMAANGWIQLAVLSPDSSELSVYQSNTFVPYTPAAKSLPTAHSSLDWYRGWREHLEFAEIASTASSVGGRP